MKFFRIATVSMLFLASQWVDASNSAVAVRSSVTSEFDFSRCAGLVDVADPQFQICVQNGCQKVERDSGAALVCPQRTADSQKPNAHTKSPRQK